jgi:hypothetical protein|tara:strand:+ start:55 stop:378 length:324 start_codon:yes stop_codon:yes gene_type:complete
MASNFDNIILHNEDGSSYRSNVNELLARQQFRFVGWECWAGIQSIGIDSNGDVYRASCEEGGKLGNIYDGFTVPADTVICNKKECACAGNLQLSKTMPKHRDKLRAT